MTTLAVSVARTDEALRSLAPAWDALWRCIPDALPFQSPAWLLPWWAQFGTSQPVAAALWADDGRLLGLLPLYVLEEAPFCRSTGQAERKLLPIGAGTTDYLDILLDPGAPADAAECLLAAALSAAAGAGLTACDLASLPPGSALIDARPPVGWREAGRWSEPGSVLVVPPDARDLADIVPVSKLRDLRLARNRAARAGGWSSETATPASVQHLLGELMRLHQNRWAADSQAGVFADPRVAAFHRSAAPELVACGMLRLWALRLGERIAALYYALVAGAGGPGARMLFYLCGYDREFVRLSPGTLLLGDILEEALRQGWRELDLLRGAEVFKSRWGAVERPIASRRLAPDLR
jgi:CelD/BcsL family acetyltransferase involved in cellulose biosynthesis